MNTRENMSLLSREVAARLGLTLDELLNMQLDLAKEYRARLVETQWIAAAADAELLGTLPLFWTWWRQRWTNRDRVVLDDLPEAAVRELRQGGYDLAIVYWTYHGPLSWTGLFPNDALWAEFDRAKRDQHRAYQHLKKLFITP